MSVDVFTYFTNMYAERVKARGGVLTKTTRYVLEVCVPTFSVSALLAVTGWITSDAIAVIMHPTSSDDVDVYFLYGFAIANFLVDVLSAGMFWIRGKSVFYHPHDHDHDHNHSHSRSTEGGDIKVATEFSTHNFANSDPENPVLSGDGGPSSSTAARALTAGASVSSTTHAAVDHYVTSRAERISTAAMGGGLDMDKSNVAANPRKKSNLNMLSAFTHVGGDTMRTFAVFLAAVIATTTDVSGAECDAWAAVVSLS